MIKDVFNFWVESLFYFICGEIFFATAFAIALQLRRKSALELAKPMPWLIVFGLLRALSEWGHVFIPIQTEIFPQFQVHFVLLNSFILALAFLCLAQFGFSLLKPRSKCSFYLAVLLLFTTWALGLYTLWNHFPRESLFYTSKNMTCYVLGIPALCGTFGGLLKHSVFIKQKGFIRVARDLRHAAFVYGAGSWVFLLFISPITFKEIIPFLRMTCAAIGLAQAIFIIRSLTIFTEEIEKQLQEIKQAYLLSQERERIARELHDGVIQSLYGASLYLESLPGRSDTDEALKEVQRILGKSITELRNYIYELDFPKNGGFLEEEIGRLLYQPELRKIPPLELHIQGEPYPLKAEEMFHLRQFLREALINVIKHAGASKVDLEISYKPKELEIKVQDNGRGFVLDEAILNKGKGLANMQRRAGILKGKMEIKSGLGKGTLVILRIPYEGR